MSRSTRAKPVDVACDATEAIALESFTPVMHRTIERGERFPRDHALVATWPEYFALMLPLSELEAEAEAEGGRVVSTVSLDSDL